MRAFLDANVLFTAAYSPQGKSRFLIENAISIGVELVSSDYAVNEAERNLIKKKNTAVADLVVIRKLIKEVVIIQRHCPINLIAKDIPIYVTAVGSGCTHLLTGDLKDFGPFMNVPKLTEGIIIQTVSEFLDSI